MPSQPPHAPEHQCASWQTSSCPFLYPWTNHSRAAPSALAPLQPFPMTERTDIVSPVTPRATAPSGPIILAAVQTEGQPGQPGRLPRASTENLQILIGCDHPEGGRYPLQPAQLQLEATEPTATAQSSATTRSLSSPPGTGANQIPPHVSRSEPTLTHHGATDPLQRQWLSQAPTFDFVSQISIAENQTADRTSPKVC